MKYFAGCIGISCLFFVTSVNAAALFAIAQPTLSGFAVCHDGTYGVENPAVNERISRSKLRQGRLYFSFTVLGGDRAIEHLKKNGAMEVILVFWAGSTKLGERSIGIKEENWDRDGPALTSEKESKGFFSWRTCGYTQKTDVSSIEVQIRDENSEFASPFDFGGSYQATVTIGP